MATVFMKWLETRPELYDRGIRLLTLGRLDRLREYLLRTYVSEGTRILEIGCGTGALVVSMSREGGVVVGIDASPLMLVEAEARLEGSKAQAAATLLQLDATAIADHFAPASFDLIVAALVLSELPAAQQRTVLAACTELLAPGGRLLVADEVLPQSWLAQLWFRLWRFPIALVTWLLTRATSRPLRDFEVLLDGAGFRTRRALSLLGGTLVLFESIVAHPGAAAVPGDVTFERLGHSVTWRTLVSDLWCLFFRIIPPYPRITPGLYAIGEPGPDEPVLVTGNFSLTVRRLVRVLDGCRPVWLLVADSAGINVWCAAGGGYFTAEKIVAALNASGLGRVVNHRSLILPQLCANGVDGWKIRSETGWGVHWGPIRAEDIPAYLDVGRKKEPGMRLVRFPLKDRLEMVTVTLGFYGLLILLPVFVFWRHLFLPAAVSLAGLSYVFAAFHPWFPGRDGPQKSITLVILALAGLAMVTAVWHPLSPQSLFRWIMGLTALSVFVGAEFQGMSPLMRGEQANWGLEAMIGVILGLIYWLVQRLAFAG